MAPVTPCVSLPTLWPLPTSLKQVGAKSQPCPCLEGSHSHPGLPEAVKSSLGTQSHLLLLLNESPSISCRDCTFSALTLGCATGFSVSFTSLATLNILQGRALCLFPCTHSPASCSCWKEGKNGVLHRCAINRCNPGKLKFTWKLN